MRNHIIDFLVTRSRSFGGATPDYDPRKVAVIRPGVSLSPLGDRQRPPNREKDMKREQLVEKLLDIKREKGWSWKHICGAIGGFADTDHRRVLGQLKLTKPQAAKAAELFGLSRTEEAMLNEVPMRGAGTPMPPTDPLIYRFYEMVMVNGPAWKALIEEEFGDGIMSAIDFDF